MMRPVVTGDTFKIDTEEEPRRRNGHLVVSVLIVDSFKIEDAVNMVRRTRKFEGPSCQLEALLPVISSVTRWLYGILSNRAS